MNTQKMKTSKISVVKNTMVAIMAVAAMGILVTSCDKDNDEKAQMNVRMTDAPAAYDAVLVDVQNVQVTYSDGKTAMLDVNAGIYSLLDFSNGADTLIASGDIDGGTVSEIKLILGTNNSVIVNSVSHALTTPSGQQAGLAVQMNKSIEGGNGYSVLLDFDANQSIVMNGLDYQLIPVVRHVDATLNGSVRGSITPIGSVAVITATGGGKSYSSVAAANGEFLVAGIPAGTYTVVVRPALPMLPVTINAVVVAVGASTSVGIVTL